MYKLIEAIYCQLKKGPEMGNPSSRGVKHKSLVTVEEALMPIFPCKRTSKYKGFLSLKSIRLNKLKIKMNWTVTKESPAGMMAGVVREMAAITFRNLASGDNGVGNEGD